MSLALALAALAAVEVAGVSHNYAIGALPNNPQRAQLPALLILPLTLDDQKTGFNRQQTSKGFQVTAFADGLKTVTYTVDHTLLLAPIAQGAGLLTHAPKLVAVMDAYFTAFKPIPTLEGLLTRPMTVRVEPGIIPFASQDFYGCTFKHTWILEA